MLGLLRFPRGLFAALFFAAALSAPALFANLFVDDLVLVLRLEGIVPIRRPGPLALYDFVSGGPAVVQALKNSSELPWWADPHLKLFFFRPLGSALFAFDTWVAGRHALFYHVHSIAWFLASVAVVSCLFRRLLPAREGALASILFAISPACWMPSGWPSARHYAVSAAFGFLALLLHVNRRSPKNGTPGFVSIPALLCTVISLAAGESALAVFAYVAAYELLGRNDALSARVRALVPWGALFGAYAALYKHLGYGASGSGGYVDPISQFPTYVAMLPSRLAVLCEAALVGLPAEITMPFPESVLPLAILGTFSVVALALLVRRALPVLDADARRTVAWLSAGALLAILPGAAGLPGYRILFLPNVGISAVLSIALLNGRTKSDSESRAPLYARALVATFAFLHLAIAPFLFGVSEAQLVFCSKQALTIAHDAEFPKLPDVTLASIGIADPLAGAYLAPESFIASHPPPAPLALHHLSMSNHDHRVKRTDDRTLEISVLGGGLIERGFEMLYRSPDAPFRIGDEVPLGTWTVRVLDVENGHPTRFSVAFDRSVDDPTIGLIQWKDGAIRSLIPPRVGEEIVVKHESGPWGL